MQDDERLQTWTERAAEWNAIALYLQLRDLAHLRCCARALANAVAPEWSARCRWTGPGDYSPQRFTITAGRIQVYHPDVAVIVPPSTSDLLLRVGMHASVVWPVASLTTLIIGGYFNQPVAHVLPPSLRHLTIRSTRFRHPLEHLPERLQTLRVLDCALAFEHSFDHLPASLKELQFWPALQYTVDGGLDALPQGLRKLTLNGHVLPTTITRLPPLLEHFGGLSLLPMLLPPATVPPLTHIQVRALGVWQAKALPPTVTIIEAYRAPTAALEHLPPRLETLIVNNIVVDPLPVSSDADRPFANSNERTLAPFPATLRVLVLDHRHAIDGLAEQGLFPYIVLPPRLEVAVLYGLAPHYDTKALPAPLKVLQCDMLPVAALMRFSILEEHGGLHTLALHAVDDEMDVDAFSGRVIPRELRPVWPPTVHSIWLPANWCFSAADIDWPASLRCLHFAGHYIHPLNHLPDGLEVLTLPLGFNQPVRRLPSNLRVLHLSRAWTQDASVLPTKLAILRIDSRDFVQPFAQ